MKIEKMIEARAEKLNEMKALNEANPVMDEATEAKYNALNKELNALTRNIELAKVENGLRDQVDTVVTTASTSPKEVDAKASLNALMSYARTGVVDVQNSVTIGGTSNGAVLIPEQYASSILTELSKTTAMRSFAEVFKTSGTFNMPIGGATPSFDWIDEGGDYPTPDLTFTNKTLEAFKAGGIILVAEELLNDESFNLQSHLQEKIVEGLSLTEGIAFITGNGVKKPKGISLDITINETLAALNVITLVDVEDVYLAVPSKARKQGSWIISDTFYKAIFRMKDSTGNYILREGSNGMPGTIFGRPFEIDDTMEGGTGEPLAIFGNLKDYKIGDRGEMAIQRLNERYSEKGFVGFKVYKRTDGKLASTKNIAQLKNA